MKLPKYRAWDHDDKKMWKVVAISESIYGDCEDSYIKVCEFDKSPMYKETDIRLSFNFDLMQFTGLYDKNGKEIYEGDIIRIYNNDDDYWDDKVSFHLGAFFSGDEDLLANVYFRAEVIGNIYENPELLEESK